MRKSCSLAHIHLPDGTMSLTWLALWWSIYLLTLFAVLHECKRKIVLDTPRIAVTAMATAVSFAIFQIEIPLAGGIHLTLTPLLGILLGPKLGTFSVLIVNIFSAAMGHGGWGLIGANSLINSIEVFLSYQAFRLVRERMSLFYSGFTAALVGLVVGNFIMIGLILVSGIQGSSLAGTEMISNISLMAAVNVFAAVVESAVTGFTLSYIKRLRPDLLTAHQSDGVAGARVMNDRAQEANR